MKKLLVLVLVLIACGESPTATDAAFRRAKAESVTGTVAVTPCWADSTTAWMVNLPLCPQKP